MCGIVGCKLKRPLTPDDIYKMRKMRDKMAHRGPDGAGEYLLEDEGLYFGHRRLSIIDPEPRSAQPFIDGDSVITYNGEIYNYVEIREELIPSESFVTSGDTEVLLKAWKKWGPDCLDKMDGMYAFAIHDQNGLHLVTDVFGEKPLYIYENQDGLYFSSEPAPLIECFQLNWSPDYNVLSDFINLGYIRPPHTGFNGLTNVAPASHITIKPNGERVDRTYWSPPDPIIGAGIVQPFDSLQIDELRDLLCASLERRLRSDVPIGLFLSGGVDSALVAALSAKELGVSLESYTVGFDDQSDETKYAKNIAQHLGITHQIIPPKRTSQVNDAPEKLMDLYGLPNDNMTGLAVETMCESAKSHLTVAVSGLGGDELFFGYNKHAYFYKNQHLYGLSPYIQPILPLLNAFPFEKFKTAAKMLYGSAETQYLRVKNGPAQHYINSLGYSNIENLLNGEKAVSYINTRSLDLLYSMPQSHIPAIDRGSMRQSIEVRTPFLNRDLLSYVYSLDQRIMVKFGSKNMLKNLLQRYMPLELLTPKKQGFVYPTSSFFMQTPDNIQMPSWVHNDSKDDLLNKAQSRITGYERVALRLCILAQLEALK